MIDQGASKAIVFAAALLAAISIAGCATRKAVEKPTATLPATPAPEPPLTAKVLLGEPIGIDQFRLRIPFAVEMANSLGRSISVDSLDCRLYIEDRPAPSPSGLASGEAPLSIAPGAAASASLGFLVDERDWGEAIVGAAGKSMAGFRVEARIGLRDEDGATYAAQAAATGSFPIVREPSLLIRSLEITRDMLVTTSLKLMIEVANPNAFPIELGSLSYDFYGEGRYWAYGSSTDVLRIPAASSALLPLAFEMNFADRDRELLDLVAQLKVVRYRLKGEAKVATGLGYLPEFLVGFDRDGSCRVQR